MAKPPAGKKPAPHTTPSKPAVKKETAGAVAPARTIRCCRHCWGEGHKYQRALAEYNREREQHRAEGKPDEEREEKGGISFDPPKDPHASCPACSGDGHARTPSNSPHRSA